MYGMANMEWLNDKLDEKMYLYFLLRKNIHPQIFPDFLFFDDFKIVRSWVQYRYTVLINRLSHIMLIRKP